MLLKMLPSADSCGNAALEVALVVDADLSRLAGDTARAKMAKGRPLVGCVSGGGGRLTVTDVSGSGAAASTLRVACTDFAWEETRGEDGHCDVARLLAVGSNCDLWLYVIGQESVDCVSSCSSHALKQMVERKELSVTELVSSRVLSFSAGRSFLLLNMRVLVQLLWEEGCSEPELVSCCSAALPPEAILTCADCQLCRGTLFMLTSSGLIYVFDSGEGRLLASVDLPLYHTAGLGEDDPVPALTSFSLLQVSEDLSTAVAATSHNLALVVDLNAYFRSFFLTHPEDLLCCMVPVRPSTKPQDHSDQDSLSSSAYSQAVLGSSFQTDCSWEAQMKLLYKRSRYPPTSHQTQGFPWFRDFPHIECRRAAATAKSSAGRVAPGGAVVLFKTQDRSAPATLAVSEFSVVLTFLSPDNRDTVVAYWDLESQTVTYHQPDSPCVPVQRSDQEGLCLLLKASGLSLVLFAVSQEELLNRLMVFGSAGTVDSLCHLNVWGRCSIPIHALEAGLKNHQLDTVDFFLKSKANVLYQPAGYSTSEPAAFVSTQTQLRNVKDLCPALDLLHSSIRDTHTEAQSRQFSEQLLSITLTFLNTQVRLLLSNTEELDESLQECVHILDAYISDLRTYLKFSWPAGGETPSPVPSNALQSRSEVEDWGSLSTEEVIQRAIMTNQIPRAQAFLRKQGSQGQRLEDLRKIGLVLAFRCLTLRDLDQATTLLRNMGFSVKKQLHSICLYTEDRDLRGFVVEELKKQKYLSEEEEQRVDFIERVERLCSSPAARCGKVMDRRRVVQAAQSDPESKRLLQELVCDCIPQSEHLLMGRVRLDWVRHWDSDTQKSIMFSRMQTPQNSCDPAVLWAYLTSLHDQHRVNQWIQSMDAQNGDPSTATQWPTLTADVVNSKTQCSIYMRNQILDMLLCGDPNLVGIRLLDLVPTVPLAELSCTVELLILSHDCFSLTCNMEGIVRVLQAARHISHTHLAHSERYSLLVRLLTGIGRYNDMTYIFDLLNQNHRFEMLLRKKVESNSGLKTALLDYIKRCLPGDSEKYNMVALCFSMCREIGENHEGAARTQLKIIESQPWAVTPELKAALLKVLTLLKDAAESYSKDSCVRQAVRCVKMAKLVTLQLHLLSHGQDQRVINLRPPELPAAVLALPHCYQSFVIAEAYDFTPDWAEVLYQKVILNGNFSYLDEFKQRRSPPASLFEEISKKVMHNKPPGNSSQNLKKLLQSCQDVYMHYKLAYEHKFFDVANMLIQESKTNSYLSDRLGS
uniref:Spatacsin C-terminal domain-containing protein n=1 Tax=Denticeps clupeoides TaxID=299321 RepID=A0AAY4E8C2_9TELE